MHKNNLKKLLSLVMALAVVFSLAAPVSAAETTLEAGTYEINSSLSCYISAMGGIEFADGLYKSASVTVDENGDAQITLTFGAGNVTIYGINCDTFIDATSVTPGYYDADGNVQNATYTLSANTALNPSSEAINYVETMTFPVEVGTETVYLWVYLNSNVMGCQFCDGSGTAASNNPGLATPYAATLTLDWSDLLTSGEEANKTTNKSATVIYTVESGYEVSIPATIAVGTDMTGTYSVALTSFVAPAGSYVTVTSDTAGTLTNGDASLAFTNALASGNLDAKDESLSGKITVTGTPTVGGEYTGTLNFVISYYEG